MPSLATIIIISNARDNSWADVESRLFTFNMYSKQITQKHSSEYIKNSSELPVFSAAPVVSCCYYCAHIFSLFIRRGTKWNKNDVDNATMQLKRMCERAERNKTTRRCKFVLNGIQSSGIQTIGSLSVETALTEIIEDLTRTHTHTLTCIIFSQAFMEVHTTPSQMNYPSPKMRLRSCCCWWCCCWSIACSPKNSQEWNAVSAYTHYVEYVGMINASVPMNERASQHRCGSFDYSLRSMSVNIIHPSRSHACSVRWAPKNFGNHVTGKQ